MFTGPEGTVNREPLCRQCCGILRILNEHWHSATKYNLKYEVTTTKKQLVKHADYSSVANCQTKIPAILWGIFENLWHLKIFIYLFHSFCRETPNDVMQNRGCETLL
jgi:hypothetical protein